MTAVLPVSMSTTVSPVRGVLPDEGMSGSTQHMKAVSQYFRVTVCATLNPHGHPSGSGNGATAVGREDRAQARHGRGPEGSEP